MASNFWSQDATAPLMTPKDLAEFLNVKVDRVYELVATKQLRAKRVGRQLRFAQKDIDDFLERNSTMG